MPSALRVVLTAEEERTLLDLSQAECVPERTRNRARALRLNARGLALAEIATYLDWAPQTVRKAIHRWHQQGLMGLWDAPHVGPQPRWQDSDIAYLETCLEQAERTFTSAQLAQKLSLERQISLSADRLRRILKKRAGDGSGRGKSIVVVRSQP